jgi:hypothetical protein
MGRHFKRGGLTWSLRAAQAHPKYKDQSSLQIISSKSLAKLSVKPLIGLSNSKQ